MNFFIAFANRALSQSSTRTQYALSRHRYRTGDNRFRSVTEGTVGIPRKLTILFPATSKGYFLFQLTCTRYATFFSSRPWVGYLGSSNLQMHDAFRKRCMRSSFQAASAYFASSSCSESSESILSISAAAPRACRRTF